VVDCFVTRVLGYPGNTAVTLFSALRDALKRWVGAKQFPKFIFILIFHFSTQATSKVGIVYNFC
jgi:hypothetical protein